jgi:hypothetical protein
VKAMMEKAKMSEPFMGSPELTGKKYAKYLLFMWGLK